MNVVRFCSRRALEQSMPRRHLVEQAHRRLARGRLVAVRGGRDPGERGPVADLREALVGRDVALAHAATRTPASLRPASRLAMLSGVRDDRVDDLAPEGRVGHLLLDHPHARVVLRRHRDRVLVGLQVGRQAARRRAGARRRRAAGRARCCTSGSTGRTAGPCVHPAGSTSALARAGRRHERRGDRAASAAPRRRGSITRTSGLA